MRRHLPRLLLTGALLSPVTLYALGLGEIRLNSALNQPFNAEIELLSPTPEELGSLRVALASQDVFSRYGIDRPQYLSNFDFSVSRGRDGKATIKVTSNRSVTEPYVTLLVEASWARGRLVREYTVLLDPPVLMPSQNEAPAPVTTPQSATTAEGRIERRQTPAPEPTPAPPPAVTPRPTPAAPTPAPEPTRVQRVEEPTDSQVIASPGSEYTVQRNDTLSKIAAAANPGGRSVNNRTMIALFRANPQAFSGNINRLRAGSVLRIPELAEIEAISAGEAGAEVARQAAEWSGGVVADTTAEADRLRLVTPQETPTPPTPAPQQQAQQQPQPSARPGTPSAPDRRLEVENPGLAQAQKNVEPTPAAPVAEPTPPPTEAQAPTEPTPAEESAAPVAEAPAQTPPAATPPPAASEPTLVERLTEYWWVLIALGLAVVLGVLFMRRRRDAEDDTLDSLSTPLAFDPPSERPARALAPSNKGARADAFLVEGEDDAGLVKTNLDDDLDFDEPVQTQRREPARAFDAAPAPAARSVEDTLSSESAVRFDQQDALAEADFHMAYGLYDQAADLVKIAIDREPGRRDLKLKLLEIYFVWGNKDLFLDTARDLYETRHEAAAGEWDKVLIMGKQIAAENEMFKGEGSHVGLVDVNLEGGENRVDVDLFAEPSGDDRQGLDLEFASGEHRGPTDATQVASDLDFLLDEPNDDDTQEQRTREVDALARTQETPTIESPVIDRTSQTVREKVDKAVFSKGTSTGDTAELSIDDLGLDVDNIEHERALEDTNALEKDLTEDVVQPLRDDEMTQLAPSLSSFDRTMEAPRVAERFDGDIESTGTIYIDQVDLTGGGDTAEHRRPDVDSTASLKKPLGLTDIDLDLEELSDVRPTSDTVRQSRDDDDIFSSDVFGPDDRTHEVPRGGVDLDVGDSLTSSEDREPTQRHAMATEMELSELEPVTMSEVGTKLDLARAYMDMGDPDGARSILDEVLSEGNPSQKQEAQRLMDSIR
ncbi:FimV/HubP family polar landmark protein [Steroidobacter sp.]|uniref:FimV/HubP family polar landmark protein n=1 Tax=Steroidobacter sp. TaxID=1978227 RepID=UPI001A5D50AD|nr:FimV/HubP family polar landmark protein [Steroidobacter sp.]MBL8267376.1 LysM peptidoglycan-binding domain-containing protein [Steroidobacter sp.]